MLENSNEGKENQHPSHSIGRNRSRKKIQRVYLPNSQAIRGVERGFVSARSLESCQTLGNNLKERITGSGMTTLYYDAPKYSGVQNLRSVDTTSTSFSTNRNLEFEASDFAKNLANQKRYSHRGPSHDLRKLSYPYFNVQKTDHLQAVQLHQAGASYTDRDQYELDQESQQTAEFLSDRDRGAYEKCLKGLDRPLGDLALQDIGKKKFSESNIEANFPQNQAKVPREKKSQVKNNQLPGYFSGNQRRPTSQEGSNYHYQSSFNMHRDAKKIKKIDCGGLGSPRENSKSRKPAHLIAGERCTSKQKKVSFDLKKNYQTLPVPGNNSKSFKGPETLDLNHFYQSTGFTKDPKKFRRKSYRSTTPKPKISKQMDKQLRRIFKSRQKTNKTPLMLKNQSRTFNESRQDLKPKSTISKVMSTKTMHMDKSTAKKSMMKSSFASNTKSHKIMKSNITPNKPKRKGSPSYSRHSNCKDKPYYFTKSPSPKSKRSFKSKDKGKSRDDSACKDQHLRGILRRRLDQLSSKNKGYQNSKKRAEKVKNKLSKTGGAFDGGKGLAFQQAMGESRLFHQTMDWKDSLRDGATKGAGARSGLGLSNATYVLNQTNPSNTSNSSFYGNSNLAQSGLLSAPQTNRRERSQNKNKKSNSIYDPRAPQSYTQAQHPRYKKSNRKSAKTEKSQPEAAAKDRSSIEGCRRNPIAERLLKTGFGGEKSLSRKHQRQKSKKVKKENTFNYHSEPVARATENGPLQHPKPTMNPTNRDKSRKGQRSRLISPHLQKGSSGRLSYKPSASSLIANGPGRVHYKGETTFGSKSNKKSKYNRKNSRKKQASKTIKNYNEYLRMFRDRNKSARKSSKLPSASFKTASSTAINSSGLAQGAKESLNVNVNLNVNVCHQGLAPPTSQLLAATGMVEPQQAPYEVSEISMEGFVERLGNQIQSIDVSSKNRVLADIEPPQRYSAGADFNVASSSLDKNKLIEREAKRRGCFQDPGANLNTSGLSSSSSTRPQENLSQVKSKLGRFNGNRLDSLKGIKKKEKIKNSNVNNNKENTPYQAKPVLEVEEIEKDKDDQPEPLESPLYRPVPHNQQKTPKNHEAVDSVSDSMDPTYELYYQITTPEQNSMLLNTLQLDFLSKCGNKLWEISQNLKNEISPYQEIRMYTDSVQDPNFEIITSMFINPQAKSLFSKILKIERWAVILLFYFCVAFDEKGIFFTDKNLANKLTEMMAEVFRNHNHLVNWIKVLNREYQIGWVLNDVNMIYYDVGYDLVRLIIEVKSCCRIITGIINQLTKYLDNQYCIFQDNFFKNIDKWDAVVCFEKGFECFYDIFIEKGVIIIHRENEGQDEGSGEDGDPKKAKFGANPGFEDQANFDSARIAAKARMSANRRRHTYGRKGSNAAKKNPLLEQSLKAVIEETDEDLEEYSVQETNNNNVEKASNLHIQSENQSLVELINKVSKPSGAQGEARLGESGSFSSGSSMSEVENQDLKNGRQLAISQGFVLQPDLNQLLKDKRENLLPPISRDRVYTLILDLDETLIHYCQIDEKEEPQNSNSGLSAPRTSNISSATNLTAQSSPKKKHLFLVRPYVKTFLKQVSDHYELVIFTASAQSYADYILDILDPENQYISYRLYRRHCDRRGDEYIKDLSKLGRELSKTLIVDNNCRNFRIQPDNGILIKSWTGEEGDEALMTLAPFLEQIVVEAYPDVRVAMKQIRKIAEMTEDAEIESSDGLAGSSGD